MKKIHSIVITSSISTVDNEGNTIDNVVHISDTIGVEGRKFAAVQEDTNSVSKSIKFGMDRLNSKLSGQMELDVPAAPAPIADILPLETKTDSEAGIKEPAKKR